MVKMVSFMLPIFYHKKKKRKLMDCAWAMLEFKNRGFYGSTVVNREKSQGVGETEQAKVTATYKKILLGLNLEYCCIK